MRLFPNNLPKESALIEVAWQRLLWLYGSDRAHLIVTGKDEATNTDIAAWNRLGGSRAMRVVRP